MEKEFLDIQGLATLSVLIKQSLGTKLYKHHVTFYYDDGEPIPVGIVDIISTLSTPITTTALLDSACANDKLIKAIYQDGVYPYVENTFDGDPDTNNGYFEMYPYYGSNSHQRINYDPLTSLDDTVTLL